MSLKKMQAQASDDDVVVVIGDTTVAEDELVAVEEDAAPELPKRAALQPDGSVMLTFRFPRMVKRSAGNGAAVREETFEQLHMHRLNGADMRAISTAVEGSRAVVAIAKSSRLHEAVIKVLYDKLDAADANAASEVVGYFLDTGRKTGR